MMNHIGNIGPIAAPYRQGQADAAIWRAAPAHYRAAPRNISVNLNLSLIHLGLIKRGQSSHSYLFLKLGFIAANHLWQ